MSWGPREFGRSELLKFVRAVDRNLTAPATVIVVGGSAAILGYDALVRTADIDLFESGTDNLALFKEASELAQKQTKLAVGVDNATVVDIPFNYQDRARSLNIPELERLTINVPDGARWTMAETAIVRSASQQSHRTEAATQGSARPVLSIRRNFGDRHLS